MRKLQDGWYVTSDKGPMVAHVPGAVVETPWDSRMQAPVPHMVPEAPGAVMNSDDETATWTTRDGGKTFETLRNGLPHRRHHRHGGKRQPGR